MPINRNPLRDEAKKIYLEKKGKITLKNLAEMLNVNYKTLTGWKSKDNWDKGIRKRVRKGGQKGNKNAKGNKGGSGAGVLNDYNLKHGFYSKILPEDALELLEDIKEFNPMDMLWDTLIMQYLSIIRAQKIMHVKSQRALTKVLKRQKESSGAESSSWEKEWELQFAWDKQATFMQAQSKAITTFMKQLDQYESMISKDQLNKERMAKLALIKANTILTKKNVEIANAKLVDPTIDKVAGIKDFLEVTKANKEEIDEMFDDEVGEVDE